LGCTTSLHSVRKRSRSKSDAHHYSTHFDEDPTEGSQHRTKKGHRHTRVHDSSSKCCCKAGGGLGRPRPGLSGTPSLLRLCCQFGVAKVVWATCGAAGCVGSLPMAVLWRRGAGCYHNFERAIGIVQSSESLHRLSVGVVTALFGRRSPCRGHHGEVLHSRRVGFSGETSSIWMCDGGATTS
jgi:hypothetical protein